MKSKMVSFRVLCVLTFLLALLSINLYTPASTASATSYPCNISAYAYPLHSSSQFINCSAYCATYGTPTSPCEILLEDGIYYLVASIDLPSNTIIKSKIPGHRDQVVLTRHPETITPGAVHYHNMSSIIRLIGVQNVRVESLRLDGKKYVDSLSDIDYRTYENIHVSNCTNCTIYQVNSEGAGRYASIDIQSGTNIVVADSYVHDNGTFNYRSDGITVHAVGGNSRIEHNYLVNNTDINLIIGGGSTGSLLVKDNTVAPHTLTGSTLISGAAFMFDTIPGWSVNCYPDCGEFGALTVTGNVNNCGSACHYGVAIGSHLNNNWNYGVTALPVKGLKIYSDNVFGRVTLDYSSERSIIDPTCTSCKRSSLSGFVTDEVKCQAPNKAEFKK
jgi:hypothetical protein